MSTTYKIVRQRSYVTFSETLCKEGDKVIWNVTHQAYQQGISIMQYDFNTAKAIALVLSSNCNVDITIKVMECSTWDLDSDAAMMDHHNEDMLRNQKGD